MTLYIVAASLALGGIVLFVVSRFLSGKVLDVAGTETSRAADLADLATAVGKEIGAGSFAQMTEVKGKARAVEALKADFSGTDCVWYECTVTREWEEDYWETDKDGNRQRRTRRGTETLSSIKREPPFKVEDPSGSVLVDPRGASIEAEKTWSSFEQGQGGASLQVGAYLFNGFVGAAGGRRTLGYRFEERSIPEGRELYILGEARDQGGTLSIRKPAKGRFIVSTRSEEDILKGARSGVLWTRIIAAVLGVSALVCLALALLGVGAV